MGSTCQILHKHNGKQTTTNPWWLLKMKDRPARCYFKFTSLVAHQPQDSGNAFHTNNICFIILEYNFISFIIVLEVHFITKAKKIYYTPVRAECACAHVHYPIWHSRNYCFAKGTQTQVATVPEYHNYRVNPTLITVRQWRSRNRFAWHITFHGRELLRDRAHDGIHRIPQVLHLLQPVCQPGTHITGSSHHKLAISLIELGSWQWQQMIRLHTSKAIVTHFIVIPGFSFVTTPSTQ